MRQLNISYDLAHQSPFDRKLRAYQQDKFFDLLELAQAETEQEMKGILQRQLAKAESMLTKEEAALVREQAVKIKHPPRT